MRTTLFFRVFSALIILFSGTLVANGSPTCRELLNEKLSDNAQNALGSRAVFKTLLEEERELEALARAHSPGSTTDPRRLVENISKDNVSPEKKLELINQWNVAAKRFEDLYDAHTQKKFDYLFQNLMERVDDSGKQLISTLGESSSTAKTLKKMQDDLQEKYNVYLSMRQEYGKGKDYKRLAAISKLFDGSVNYLLYVKDLREGRNAFIGQLSRSLIKKIEVMQLVFCNIWEILKAAVSVTDSFRAAVGTEEYESLISRVARLFKNFGTGEGYHVKIQQKGKIPRTNSKTVNIFMPNHTDAEPDMVVLGNIVESTKINPIVFVTAALPKPMYQVASQHNAIVLVGRDLQGNKIDAVGNLLTRLKNGDWRSIYYYPEGSLQAGIKDTRPARPGFVRKLREEGYNVNLIPVSQINSYRFFGQASSQERNLDVVIQQAIPTHVVDQLLAHGDEDVLTRFIRSYWLVHFPTNDVQVAGQLRLSEIEKRINEMVGANP